MSSTELFATLKGIKFELSYVDKPEDIAGEVICYSAEFKPSWEAQHLADGLSHWFDTREEAVKWMLEWDEITE